MQNILASTLVLLCITYGSALPAEPTLAGPAFGGPVSGNLMAHLQSVPNSRELMMCAQPVMSFVFSQFTGGRRPSQGPTREQFTQVCSTAKNFFQCVDNWFATSNMQVSPDVRTVIQATGRILNFCDEPNAYENITRFVACGKKLDAAPNECPEWKQSKSKMEEKFKGAEPLEVLKTIKLVEDLCCRTKQIAPCVTAKTERLCGATDRDFFQSMVDRLNIEFKCATRTSNCAAVLA